MFLNRAGLLLLSPLLMVPSGGLASGYQHAGDALRDQERYPEAIVQYRKALSYNPLSAPLHTDIGYSFCNAGRYKEAASEFHAALQIDRNFLDGQNGLGCANYHTGHYNESLGHYQLALGINPASGEAHYGMGNVLTALGRRDEAVGEYRTAIRLDPEHPYAYSALGDVYYDLQRYPEALAMYHQSPDREDGYYRAGFVYWEQGLRAQSIREWQAAVRLDPTDQDALDWLQKAQTTA